MKPPEAPENETGNTPPAVSVCPKPLTLTVLKKRSDFLRAARARHERTPSMSVQARNRNDGTAQTRIGFTCSKKVGNAVARNRAKRRLREAARLVLTQQGREGWDYVLIGRAQVTAATPFDRLCQDLMRAVERLHTST